VDGGTEARHFHQGRGVRELGQWHGGWDPLAKDSHGFSHGTEWRKGKWTCVRKETSPPVHGGSSGILIIVQGKTVPACPAMSGHCADWKAEKQGFCPRGCILNQFGRRPQRRRVAAKGSIAAVLHGGRWPRPLLPEGRRDFDKDPSRRRQGTENEWLQEGHECGIPGIRARSLREVAGRSPGELPRDMTVAGHWQRRMRGGSLLQGRMRRSRSCDGKLAGRRKPSHGQEA
jgi:hypothetical protein